MKNTVTLLLSLVLVLVLLAISFAAFTGYVAYSGMHKFELSDAFREPPREDAARLGGVLEAGLAWAMKVCGTVLTLVGSALAFRRAGPVWLLASLTAILAGVVLITQHWAAGIALAAVGIGVVVGAALERMPAERS
jgi:hypothetical protein